MTKKEAIKAIEKLWRGLVAFAEDRRHIKSDNPLSGKCVLGYRDNVFGFGHICGRGETWEQAVEDARKRKETHS